MPSLVGSEMCIRDRAEGYADDSTGSTALRARNRPATSTETTIHGTRDEIAKTSPTTPKLVGTVIRIAATTAHHAVARLKMLDRNISTTNTTRAIPLST